MLGGMHMILDALWRALVDGLRGRALAWSLFPLLLVAVLAMVVAVVWWDGALLAVQAWLERASGLQWLWTWMGRSADTASAVVAAVVLLLLMGPVLIIAALAVVAVVMTPQMVAWVAQRRFPALERKRGASWRGSLIWSLGSTAMALTALVLSLPLWLVPPVMLVVPPLIWGWLTYRVMAFDALAEHASRAERQAIFKTHRWRLMGMGLMCGLVSAAPSVVWASGLVFVAAFWVLIPIALCIYAWVLAFSSLWFAHYGLAALSHLRANMRHDDAMCAPASTAVL